MRLQLRDLLEGKVFDGLLDQRGFIPGAQPPVYRGGQCDVLSHGAIGEQPTVAVHESDTGPEPLSLAVLCAVHIATEQLYAAAKRFFHGGQYPGEWSGRAHRSFGIRRGKSQPGARGDFYRFEAPSLGARGKTQPVRQLEHSGVFAALAHRISLNRLPVSE